MIEALRFISLPINEIRKNDLKKDEISSNTDKETNFSYNENTNSSNNIINNNSKSEIKYIKYENSKIKDISQTIKLLTVKPIYNIPIDNIINNTKLIDNSIKENEQKHNNENNNYIMLNNKEKISKNEKIIKFVKYEYKPNFNIPIEKIKEELNEKNKTNNKNIINTKNEIKNEDNKNLNNTSNKNLKLNNNNQMNNNNQIYYLNGFNSNFGNSKYLNTNYNNILLTIFEQKAQFKILKDMGMRALMNPQNINNYLLNNYFISNINTNINN